MKETTSREAHGKIKLKAVAYNRAYDRYPIEITSDGRFLAVSFPDIPEALTQGSTIEEARIMAAEAFELALDFYFESNREIPPPSVPGSYLHTIPVPDELAAELQVIMRGLGRRGVFHRSGTIRVSRVDCWSSTCMGHSDCLL